MSKILTVLLVHTLETISMITFMTVTKAALPSVVVEARAGITVSTFFAKALANDRLLLMITCVIGHGLTSVLGSMFNQLIPRISKVFLLTVADLGRYGLAEGGVNAP